ncbi:uncharacterized protein LOC144626986 [Crassostrea virginica]
MTRLLSSGGHRNKMKIFFLLLVNGVVGPILHRFEKSRHMCFTNYELKDEVCVPCIGTFGDDCSGGPCMEGYYGFGCQSKCNCSTHHQCNRIKGCVNLTDDGTVYKYGCEIAISILCILFVISVGVNIFLKCRMSSQTITQEQTGQENYDNLSDSKEGHIYTAMATPK